ncbi:MAG: hypothetical protein HYX53_02710 [Chloroflexi bacterium]|nr:hypothetical protein [Chloroflexota bacterium]
MASLRPVPVGSYELLQDFECRDASIRVLRLADVSNIEPHVHHQSRQVYVALEGASIIDIDGTETELLPYAALEVPPGRLHSARPAAGSATLMNISVPPLEADDQIRVATSRP